MVCPGQGHAGFRADLRTVHACVPGQCSVANQHSEHQHVFAMREETRETRGIRMDTKGWAIWLEYRDVLFLLSGNILLIHIFVFVFFKQQDDEVADVFTDNICGLFFSISALKMANIRFIFKKK